MNKENYSNSSSIRHILLLKIYPQLKKTLLEDLKDEIFFNNFINSHKLNEKYNNIYNQYITKNQLKIYTNKKNEIIEHMENIIKNILNDNNYQIYQICINLVNEYKDILKKRFNTIKQKEYILKTNLEKLDIEIGISISKYFSIKYNMPELYVPFKKSKVKKINQNNEFNYYLDSLKDVLKQIDDEENRINMEIKHMETNFLNFIEEISLSSQQTSEIPQKKLCWSSLNINVKKEKIIEFAKKYIIEKIYLDSIKNEIELLKKQNENKGLTEINIENDVSLIDKLSNVLIDKFNNKELKYKNIKWNNKNGTIIFIKGLKITLTYNSEFNLIELNWKLKIDPSVHSIKSSNTTSIIQNSKNIENLNENILYFIFEKNNFKKISLNDLKNEEYIIKCEEYIKKKNISLSNSFIKKLFKQNYLKILSVIQSNDQSSKQIL